MILAFWIGLYPKPFFQILSTPVNNLVATVRPDYPGLTKPVVAGQPAVNTAARNADSITRSRPKHLRHRNRRPVVRLPDGGGGIAATGPGKDGAKANTGNGSRGGRAKVRMKL